MATLQGEYIQATYYYAVLEESGFAFAFSLSDTDKVDSDICFFNLESRHFILLFKFVLLSVEQLFLLLLLLFAGCLIICVIFEFYLLVFIYNSVISWILNISK